jgi:hypothetical protein
VLACEGSSGLVVARCREAISKSCGYELSCEEAASQ